jgi:hypothetical protein
VISKETHPLSCGPNTRAVRPSPPCAGTFRFGANPKLSIKLFALLTGALDLNRVARTTPTLDRAASPTRKRARLRPPPPGSSVFNACPTREAAGGGYAAAGFFLARHLWRLKNDLGARIRLSQHAVGFVPLGLNFGGVFFQCSYLCANAAHFCRIDGHCETAL